jgi:hypothetical protein
VSRVPWELVGQIVDKIRDDHDGNSVAFTGDNPDFNGQPNCCVTIQASFTGWNEQDYRADTVEQCVMLAFIDMENHWREAP